MQYPVIRIGGIQEKRVIISLVWSWEWWRSMSIYSWVARGTGDGFQFFPWTNLKFSAHCFAMSASGKEANDCDDSLINQDDLFSPLNTPPVQKPLTLPGGYYYRSSGSPSNIAAATHQLPSLKNYFHTESMAPMIPTFLYVIPSKVEKFLIF